MAYSNSYGYNSFYRPNPPFYPPTSFPNFNDYTQPTRSSLNLIYPFGAIIAKIHYILQCPSIGYPLGLGQNQFHTF